MHKFKEFQTPEEVEKWAFQSYTKDVLEHFDLNKQSLLSPLILYTGSIPGRINNSLRTGDLDDDTSHFEGLQYDLCHCALPESITVWRYIDRKEQLILWKKTLFGRKYIYPSFVSTTLLRDFFSGQARQRGIVIRINAPAGTPGMYIPELKCATIEEYEVLFAHHLAIKRTGRRTYEFIPELPADSFRGQYVDESDYDQLI